MPDVERMVPVRQLASSSMPATHRKWISNVLAMAVQSGAELTPVGNGHVNAVEDLLSSHVGRTSAVATSSGTAALQVAVEALLGGRSGAPFVLVTSAFTYVATAMPALWSQTGLRLVDVAPGSMLPDDDDVTAAVLGIEGIPILVPVHLGGDFAEWPKARAATRERGGFIVDDAAQRLAPFPGVDTDAICLSLGPTKNVCGVGESGALVLSDDTVATRARSVVRNGNQGAFDHHRRGGNFAMSPLNAAVLVDHLPRLVAWDERRASLARRYSDAIGSTSTFVRLHAEDSVQSKYCCYFRGPREQLESMALEHAIEIDWHYPRGLHRQPALRHLVGDSYTGTDQLCAGVVSLPVHQFLSDAECERVVRMLMAVDHEAGSYRGTRKQHERATR